MCLQDLQMARRMGNTTHPVTTTSLALPADPRRVRLIVSCINGYATIFAGSTTGDPQIFQVGSGLNETGATNNGNYAVLRVEDFGLILMGNLLIFGTGAGPSISVVETYLLPELDQLVSNGVK